MKVIIIIVVAVIIIIIEYPNKLSDKRNQLMIRTFR